MPMVKLPGGFLRDEVRTPLYDTLTIEAGQSPVGVRTFFSDVQGKPRHLTNMKQNGLLETSVSYRIQGMAIDAQNVYDENFEALPLILENSSLRLHIGEKDYWEGPMLFAAGRLKSYQAIAAVGLTTDDGAARDAARIYQHFGDEAIQGVMFPGDHFVDITSLQSFYVQWNCGDQGSGAYALTADEIEAMTPAAGTRLRLMLSLKGLLRRPVQ